MNAPLATERRWRARLALEYAAGGARTYLRRREHAGPLLVQRSFHPEPGGVSHSSPLHPPSGLVGGDSLELDVTLTAGAAVLLTTPAATKFYRSAGDTARLTQRLRLDAGASGEWLPQENLLYDGARAAIVTSIDLAASARFIGWEIACFGRPAGDEGFARGHADTRLELRRDGRPLVLERLRVDGEPAARGAGLRGHAVSATLVAVGDDEAAMGEALARARAVEPREALGGVTLVAGVLICRALAAHTAPVRAWFEALWVELRPLLLGRPAVAPRIWAT